MNKHLQKIVWVGLISLVLSCNATDTPHNTSAATFHPAQVLGTITDSRLAEVSGIAASVAYEGCFWVHNDSGDEARIFLINSRAETVAEVKIAGIKHRDWEDIATVTDANTGKTHIYIAEIGDNRAQYDLKYIYILEEPVVDTSTLNQTTSTTIASTITFRLEDGIRDAETILIDPSTQDIYIVSKREKNVGVYALPYPQSTSDIIIAPKVQTLPFTKANGGDISRDGSEILIKNYDTIYYWRKSSAQTVAQALADRATNPPYSAEPQGEAIAWLNNGSAFVTLSEESDSHIEQKLYIYRRK